MTAILEPRPAQVGEQAPPVTAPAPRLPAAPIEPQQRRVRPVLSIPGVRTFGAIMFGLFALGIAVQPAPDGPDPVTPWWDELTVNVIFFGLIALFVGCAAGRRWALPVGLGVGGTFLFGSLTCPLEGHHEIAAWWFVQMAVAVAMTVLPATLLRRTQAGSRAG